MLNLPRRRFLQLAAGAATLPAAPRIAMAQDYPVRPVRIVVGFPPGGPIDISARITAQWLSERLGQQFIVDNHPGAGGTLGAESVIRAAPDGYTLLMANGADAVNASLIEKLGYVFVRDAVAVASVNRIPHVVEINPAFPVQTVPALIAYAKANPGKVSVATPGVGTGPYMAAELLKMMAGIDMVNVPYRGAGPMLVDVLGGQVQVAFDGITSSISHIRSGELKALGVTSAKRLDALPDVPSVGEFVPGYEEVSWCGLVAPLNTPPAIVAQLNGAVNAGLADPKIKSRFADLGVVVLPGSPANFQKLIGEETEKWAKVIKFAGIKAQ
jgi:tripartite-type tricarboxylate transporter receptor subunit TctC